MALVGMVGDGRLWLNHSIYVSCSHDVLGFGHFIDSLDGHSCSGQPDTMDKSDEKT